jgi:hypothetical protein
MDCMQVWLEEPRIVGLDEEDLPIMTEGIADRHLAYQGTGVLCLVRRVFAKSQHDGRVHVVRDHDAEHIDDANQAAHSCYPARARIPQMLQGAIPRRGFGINPVIGFPLTEPSHEL